MSGKLPVRTTINGVEYEFLADPRQTLVEVLRETLRLTGTKEGCSNGNCGACSVLINGRVANSCIILAVQADGLEIETIEGMADGLELDPLQTAFLEEAALQCGICTPGILMAAKALLAENPDPTEAEVRHYLAGNLCRCTGYDKIVRAVLKAAEMKRKESPNTQEVSA